MKVLSFIAMTSVLFVSQVCFADITVPMHSVTDDKDFGAVTIKESKTGLVFIPNLHDLPPGKHGFHIHTNPVCPNQGKDAGTHYDPLATGKHLGPYSTLGHLGDLPVLTVKENGKATAPVVAPKLKMDDLKNRSLIIHVGGDNYSDRPEKSGGGKEPLACGVITE